MISSLLPNVKPILLRCKNLHTDTPLDGKDPKILEFFRIKECIWGGYASPNDVVSKPKQRKRLRNFLCKNLIINKLVYLNKNREKIENLMHFN